MTDMISDRSRIFFDFEIRRNQEWLRRRKLRLEQVRKQSSDIAKALRQRVTEDEKTRLEKYDKITEAQFKDWKAVKLDELERKFRCELEEFGEGYRLAEAEPDWKDVINEKNKVNMLKAQKRGEIAGQQELRKKKMDEEKKMSPIQRKKMTRKKEDLRSALVRSVPVKKQLINTQEVYEGKVHPVKISMKKVRKKKMTPNKSCDCKNKSASEACSFKDDEPIWINLDEIQDSSAGDSGFQPKNNNSSKSNVKSQNVNSERAVEFFDFSSRYYCKSFREFPYLVERIDPETEALNANELLKIENEKEKKEVKKKVEISAVAQERGMEALRREKIQRDYNTLIAKLEELNKKEKKLKTQQRNPSFLHMTDERLSQISRTKQRMMESKFENIYYEATSQIPQTERELPSCQGGGGGDFELGDRPSTRLSFSPSNLKPNTPITSDPELSAETSLLKKIRRSKKRKKNKQLLLDINKALKEGKELRKTTHKSWESKIIEEDEKEQSSSDSESAQTKSFEALPRKVNRKMSKSQESQTEHLKFIEEDVEKVDLKSLDKTGDESFAVSSSTSYKSLPSVIKSYRLRQFLDYVEEFIQVKDNSLMGNNSKCSEGIDKLMQDLLCEVNFSKTAENEKKTCTSPTLEYYIEKLLSLSRECIANLSVSSENISTPNITDLDEKVKAQESEFFEGVPSAEDINRKSRLEGAEQVENLIKDWKKIFEDVEELHPELKDEPLTEPDENEAVRANQSEEVVGIVGSPKIKNRYDEITKKCSERISELSKLLDKVRQDKEKLLSSTSGGSSLSLSKDGKAWENELDVNVQETETAPLRRERLPLENSENFPVLKHFINRCSFTRPGKENASSLVTMESQSLQDPEESLESWPDVMDELLKREILTSPFKWSDGEYSLESMKISDSESKQSSVETVFGNFRQEIRKIKPFSLSDSVFQSNSCAKLRHSFNEGCLELLCNSQKKVSPGKKFSREESSLESINQALTSLGLNWARSFLKKNEESRAMSSSSNSEQKSLADEEDA